MDPLLIFTGAHGAVVTGGALRIWACHGDACLPYVRVRVALNHLEDHPRGP